MEYDLVIKVNGQLKWCYNRDDHQKHSSKESPWAGQAWDGCKAFKDQWCGEHQAIKECRQTAVSPLGKWGALFRDLVTSSPGRALGPSFAVLTFNISGLINLSPFSVPPASISSIRSCFPYMFWPVATVSHSCRPLAAWLNSAHSDLLGFSPFLKTWLWVTFLTSANTFMVTPEECWLDNDM